MVNLTIIVGNYTYVLDRERITLDKYEYKVRADEIKELIAGGEYPQAAEIADTIDWRRVKSVMMLCTISDLYKINRRYEDAKNMLLLAYERRPGGKTICYSLCELCIKTEEFVQAVNYYKEFVQVAPKDPGRYILQYKLYEAQDVSLEERIGVLEELKKKDYREKWAYELAYLYHRVGLATRCVEECDELILWFGEGKYVIKAMELKMLHQPLTAAQQEKYDHRFDGWGVPQSAAPESETEVQAKSTGAQTGWEAPAEEHADVEEVSAETAESVAVQENVRQPEEMDIQVKTMDVGQYNTINLQAELAAGLKEVLAGDQTQSDAITRSILAPLMDSDTESLDLPEIDEVDESDLGPEAEVMEGSEVFFGETGDLSSLQQESVVAPEGMEEILPEGPETGNSETGHQFAEQAKDAEPDSGEEPAKESIEESIEKPSEKSTEKPTEEAADDTAEIVMNQLRMESAGQAEEQVLTAQPPKELAHVLSQESDGQISLVVPESETIEKQITGQMSIEDILAEWERMKKENEEKRKEEVRQHVLQQTGTMFTEFEASVRDGLLEKLESGKVVNIGETENAEAAEAGAGFAEAENAEAESEETENAEAVEADAGYEAENAEAESAEAESAEAENAEAVEADAGYEAENAEAESAEAESAEAENAEAVEADAEYAAEFGEAENVEAVEADAGYEAGFAEAESAEAESAETENAEAVEADAETEVEFAEEEEADNESGQEPGDDTAEEYSEDEYGEVEEIEEIDETDGTEEPEEAGEDVEKPADQPKAGQPSHVNVEREKIKVRALTREEKELYAPFIQSRSGREKLVKAIDNVSMAAYTGNIIITGEEGMDTLSLAKNMIREVQMTDSNFSGKVAKISGQGMNSKNVEETLNHLESGALIIQKASDMEAETVESLYKSLQKESIGIIIVLEDTKKAMGKLLTTYPQLAESFTARMDVEAMSNDSLVSYARQYAREMEYSIDEMGVLALHTRIEELQTSDHVVTVAEVKEIMDEAIRHANRKSLGHFFDILFAKRYDDEDMIILTEKDFV